MAATDTVNRVLREFRRYTGDGLPGEPVNAPLPVGDSQSGVHNPKKSELREGMLATISVATTVERLVVTGGTVNAVLAESVPGGAFDNVLVYFIDITDPNTGNVTISIDGAVPVPAYNYEGEQFAPGEWHGRMFLSNEGTSLRALTADPALIAAAVASTAADRIAAEEAADRAAAFAADAGASSGLLNRATIAALLADTIYSYTVTEGKITVGPGDIITAQGFRYEVAAEDSSDYHVATVGGVRLCEAGPFFTTFARFAAAIARSEDWRDGDSVLAGGVKYVKDGGNEIAAVPGWSLDPGLEEIRSNLATVSVSSSAKPSLTDPASIVTDVRGINFADPNVADPSLPSLASQLHRLYNSGGSLSAASPSTLGTFAVSRKYDVVAGQQYTASMFGAPEEFTFYFTAVPGFLGFYNTDGSFHSQITTHVRSADDRSVTFTVPAGAERVAFNLRNPKDYSNKVPLSETALKLCVDNIMLNKGSAALPFEDYNGGTSAPTLALFDADVAGDTVLIRQGAYYFIRTPCQRSPDKDVVWRMKRGHAADYFNVDSRSGVVDFYGIRFISRGETRRRTIAAFNLSTDVHQNGMDESAPERLNGMYVGGGHGVVGFEVTKAAHTMTNVDVGSVWSDGSSQWVLYKVLDVNTLLFVRRYTGTVSAWNISSNAPAGSTFTHVSGATHTGNIAFTAPAAAQFVPILRDYLSEVVMDEAPAENQDIFVGSVPTIREIYSILNVASQQDYLIANVGSSNPNYVSDAIAEQVRVFNEFTWNRWGALQIRCGRAVKSNYARSLGAPGDYWGAIQMQRLSMPGDSTPGPHTAIDLYVPDTNPVGGINYQATADITANNALVQIGKTACTDPADPASHFCQLGKAGGAVLSGQVYGLSRAEGLGLPSARAASVANVMFFSSAEKQYPVAIDATAGNATTGQVVTATAFRAPFKPTDADLTIPAVIVTMSGINYCYITAHQSLAGKVVAVPNALTGQKITVLKAHDNVIVRDEYVSDGTITIDVANGYGDVVLKLG